MNIRLQKWLADAGIASRRKAEQYILDGYVTVNGETIRTLGTKANTENDIVCLHGKRVNIITKKIYIMLHKPIGVVTTVTDPFNRKTVMDFLPKEYRLFPVGRLDYNTSGLLLCTNDGEFAEMITHPSSKIQKTYIAKLKYELSQESIALFKQGIPVDGKNTAPAYIEIIKNNEVLIKIHEGRNRQIRKMFEYIKNPVLSLKRIAVGNIKLGKLEIGKWRYLTENEIII